MTPSGSAGNAPRHSDSELWTAVDRYITNTLVGHDPALEAALDASAASGLPPIAVSPPQGKLLWLLARLQQAREVLELGTLGAYSTIWLARAIGRGGRVVTVELNPTYAEVANANVRGAQLTDLVDQRVGPAVEVLAQLTSAGEGPFDLIFIDADKKSTPEYFTGALELSRPGTLIVTDNVVRGGGLIDANTDDEGALGMRRFHELLAAETRVTATTIQTVGAKGYDGFTVAQVAGVN